MVTNEQVIINLYTGNHNAIWGISDYIDIIRRTFLYANSGIVFHISPRLLPNEINIILEEFSKVQIMDYLRDVKKRHPKTKFWLFLTEIPNAGSYNVFSWHRYHKTHLFKVADSVFRMANTDFVPDLSFPDGISKLSDQSHPFDIFKLPRKALKKTASLVKRLAKDEGYFYKRYINTIENFSLFDEHFTIHDKIVPAFQGLGLKYFYYAIPSIDESIKDRPYWCYFSGTLTKYRRRLLENFAPIKDKVLLQLKIDDVFRDNYLSQCYFSIALPRYEGWRFSSPTRTISSLRYGSLPLEVIPSIWDEFEEPIFLNFQTLLEQSDDISSLYKAQVELVQNARTTRNKKSFQFINELLNQYA